MILAFLGIPSSQVKKTESLNSPNNFCLIPLNIQLQGYINPGGQHGVNLLASLGEP